MIYFQRSELQNIKPKQRTLLKKHALLLEVIQDHGKPISQAQAHTKLVKELETLPEVQAFRFERPVTYGILLELEEAGLLTAETRY